jgi:3',5'-cyclic AMP phosphodiesterase CpdA
MNTESSGVTSTSGVQYSFVKNDLEAARKNPNIKWIIVSFHKPFYSSPNSCSSSTCHGWKDLVRTYGHDFDTYKVDLVLQGHTHSYQRTFPLKFNSEDPLKPRIMSSKSHDYINIDGRIHAIVATGGQPFFKLEGKANFVASQQASKFGQLDIHIYRDGTSDTLVGKFCANDPNTLDPCTKSSNILDHFSLKKSISSPTSSAIPTESLDPFSQSP